MSNFSISANAAFSWLQASGPACELSGAETPPELAAISRELSCAEKLPELAAMLWKKALPEEEEAMAREAARTAGEGSPGHCGGFLTERQVLEAACLRRKKRRRRQTGLWDLLLLAAADLV